MATLASKNLDSPDETRKFKANGYMEVANLPGLTLGRAVFEPGWKWSNDVKPIAGTDSCMANHRGYVISGRMRIRMDDGKEIEVGPGDAFVCEPGHDGWVLGDDPCVVLEFMSADTYAK